MVTISPTEFVKESRKYHLTIGDVLSFPVNEKKHIFFMDRNMYDISCDIKYNPVGLPIRPSHFFRKGYYINFTRITGLHGIWEWLYDSDPHIDNDREFDVDMDRCWYPLEYDHVPNIDEQGVFKIPKKFAGKSYTQLPKDTRLGWRGPMMLVENMDKLPDIVME
jgi:hypothetical protein